MMFTIIFHGPFRIAAGAASDGLDATYDPANPLPSSSLKGVTRASAVGILGINAPLVTEIFGDPSVPSPWWWSDGEIEARPAGSGGPGRIRTQLQIDPATFTAADTALRTSGELWPPRARFEVRRRGDLASERVALHEAVLSASACAISALGSDRRRGLGWVSVIPDEPWNDAQQQLLLSCRGDNA